MKKYLSMLIISLLVLAACSPAETEEADIVEETMEEEAKEAEDMEVEAVEEEVIEEAEMDEEKEAVEEEVMEEFDLVELTLDELSAYDGSDGNPAYIAIDGNIYDVTNIPNWNGGSHNGFKAGNDLTEEMTEISPHGVSKLKGLEVVGIIVE